MRLKEVNVKNRSKMQNYDDVQKQIISHTESAVNSLGKLFDTCIELEDYILENILSELSELVEIKKQKNDIEKKESTQSYLLNYFKPAANKFETKLNKVMQEWNIIHEKCTIEKITSIIQDLKNLNNVMSSIEKNLKTDSVIKKACGTITSIQGLINEFGQFKIIKVIFAKNIVEKISILLEARDKINALREKKQEEIDDEFDNLTIDDL